MENGKKIFEELVALQKQKVRIIAEKLIPYLTEDDLLQPNDFPLLENHPIFRYEEGVLEGLRTAQMAFFAFLEEEKEKEDLALDSR